VGITMTRDNFREQFKRALDVAAESAELKLDKNIPRSFSIRLRAFGYDDRVISVDEAVDKIYLGNDSFYRIIDVAIEEVLPAESVARRWRSCE
jgi:hypothetical protein